MVQGSARPSYTLEKWLQFLSVVYVYWLNHEIQSATQHSNTMQTKKVLPLWHSWDNNNWQKKKKGKKKEKWGLEPHQWFPYTNSLLKTYAAVGSIEAALLHLGYSHIILEEQLDPVLLLY